MNSIRNLSDAGKLLPAWTLPLVLTISIMGALFYAQNHLADRPHLLVAQGTLYAVIASALAAAWLLLVGILNAKPGRLKESIGEGVVRGLNFMWSTSSVALVIYLGANHAYELVTENFGYSLATLVAATVLGIAYLINRPTQSGSAAGENSIVGQVGPSLVLPDGFAPTREQMPTFQVSIADITRLMIHQAGRLVGYAGSDAGLNDSFSADLDANARTAKIFSDMNLVSTPGAIYWRMHMLLMGSAAEHVLRNTTSESAMDDFASFEELATRFLMLSDTSYSFATPVTEAEAMIKANRIGTLRKQIWSRCVATCMINKQILLSLITVMRGQHCLSYRDIKHLLTIVELPAGFPKAEFDTDEMMDKALAMLASPTAAEPNSLSEEGSNESTAGHADSKVVAESSDTLPATSSNIYHLNA